MKIKKLNSNAHKLFTHKYIPNSYCPLCKKLYILILCNCFIYNQKNNTMNFLKNNCKALLLLLTIVLAYSCSSDDDAKPTPTPTPTATLSNMVPDSGPKGTVVSISGNHFGTDMNNITVYFNNVEATIQSVTNTEINVTVPARAYTGLVKVLVNSTELIGSEFEYIISDIQVSTLAGSTYGYADGMGSNAQFSYLSGLTMTDQGDLYVTDLFNHKIRKITPSGVVTTFAGSTDGFADGMGASAQFAGPMDITVDSQNNFYIADNGNSKIRKITSSGVVTTLAGSVYGDADGMGTDAEFTYPKGITIDNQAHLYVTDITDSYIDSQLIRKITPGGMVTTLAGSVQGYENGSGANAKFSSPRGLTVDNQGNVYVTDSGNNIIRKISPTGEVSTFAGSTSGYTDGTGADAKFNSPEGITIDSQGNLYVTDSKNHKIRKITPTGVVSTIAGSTDGFADGPGADAQFDRPARITIDNQNTLYVTDSENFKVRKITQE